MGPVNRSVNSSVQAGSATGTIGRRTRGRPITISFSGLDGAGKTYQIAALVAAVAEQHSVEVIWLPTRVWPEPLLNRLPAGFRSRLGPKRPAAVELGGSSSPPKSEVERPAQGRPIADRMRAALWSLIGSSAALSVGLALRRRAVHPSADVLVLDRYRLDSVVKLCFWYSEVSQAWLARLVLAVVPAPDVEFLLRVDPEVAYARKPEQWTVSQLARQAAIYDRLAGIAHNVVVLDGHQQPERLAREVIAHARTVLDRG